MTGSNRKKIQKSDDAQNQADSNTKSPTAQIKRNNISLTLTKKKKPSDVNIVIDVLNQKKDRLFSDAHFNQGGDEDSLLILDGEEKKVKSKQSPSQDSKGKPVIDADVMAFSEISLISPRNTERLVQNQHQLSDSDLLRLKQNWYQLLQIQDALYKYMKNSKTKPFSKKTQEILMSLRLAIFNQYHQMMVQVINHKSKKKLDLSSHSASNLIHQINKNKKKYNFSDRTQGFLNQIQKINSDQSLQVPNTALVLNQMLLLRSIDEILNPLLEFGKTQSFSKNFEKKKNQYICLDFIDLYNKMKNKINLLDHEKAILESPLIYEEIAREVYFILLKYGYIPYQEKAPKHIQAIINRYIQMFENIGAHIALGSKHEILMAKYALKKSKNRNTPQEKSNPEKDWSSSLSEAYPDLTAGSFCGVENKEKNISHLTKNKKYQILFQNLMRVVDYYEKGVLGRIIAFELGIEENRKNYWSEQIKVIKQFLLNAYLSNQHDANALIACVRGATFDIRKSIGGKDSRLAGTLEDLLEDYQEKADIGKSLFAKFKLPDKLKVDASSELDCMLCMENHLLHQLSAIFLAYLDEVDSRILGSSNDFKVKATLFLNQVVHALLRESDLDARQRQLTILMGGDYMQDKALSKSEQFQLGMKQLLEFSIRQYTPMKDIEHLDSGGFSKMIKNSFLILNLSEDKGLKLNTCLRQ